MRFVFLAALASFALPAAAVNYFAVGSNNWNANKVWSTTSCAGGSGNFDPNSAADTVTICAGVTVTLNGDRTIGSITVNGTGVLNFASSNAARSLTVSAASGQNGSIVNDGTIRVITTSSPGVATPHTLTIGGDLTNNGTFSMAADADSVIRVTFNRNGNATISGTGAMTFWQLVVSLGTSAANVLDYTADDIQFSATPAGCLLLANGGVAIPSNANCFGGLPNTATNPATGGTFKISRASATAKTITPFDNATMAASPDCYLIGAAAGFWLNSASTTVNVDDATATCNGAAAPLNLSVNGSTIRVTAGALNLVQQPNQRIRLLDNANSKYWHEGGTTTVNGRVTSVGEGNNGAFQISGGTLIVGASAAGNSDAGVTNGFFGPFFLGSGASSTFSMTGGTMIIRNQSASSPAAYAFVNGATLANSTVTGGTVQLGDASTSASGATFEICIGSEPLLTLSCTSTGAAPLWNLAVDYNQNAIGAMKSALTVKNDLTVGSTSNNSTARLNASTTSGQNLIVNHDVILGIGSAAGTAPRMDMNAASLTVGNNLTLNTNSAFNASTTSTSDISVGNNITITTGSTLAANDRMISVGSANLAGSSGLWTNNGTFTQGLGTVRFNGIGATQAQEIKGSTATTFYNLTVDKAAGTSTGRTLTISTSPTVMNTLALTAGTIATGTNKISLGVAGTVTPPPAAGANTAHVWGNFEKTFDASHRSFTYPIGDGTTYTPVNVDFTASATAPNGNLTATTSASTNVDHPDVLGGRAGIDSSKSVNRWWTLKGHPAPANLTAGGSVVAPTTYSVTAFFPSGSPYSESLSPTNVRVTRGEACFTSGGVRTCNPWGTLTTSGASANQATGSGAVMVAKDLEADFAVGETAAPRFVRQKEFIYTRELY